ncbi:hypothetical protein BHM03_00047671, partial [Ensete ventricosum]
WGPARGPRWQRDDSSVVRVLRQQWVEKPQEAEDKFGAGSCYGREGRRGNDHASEDYAR